MRRDLIHTPRIEEDGAVCAECGAWLPLDAAKSALNTPDGAVLDVGGLGSFCPTVRGALGREAISCAHPSALAQKSEITVSSCPACLGRPTETPCTICDGEGLVGFVEDPDDPDHPKVLKVQGASLSPDQLAREGLSIKDPTPLSEFDKSMNRGAFSNWLGLRDAIRPPDVEAS